MRAQFVIPVLVSILILGTLGLSQNVYASSFDELFELIASDAAAGDEFGFSVSISGDTAVVGAVNDIETALNSGSAYVFVKSGNIWTQEAKLTASDPAAVDQFGHTVSISGDTVIVGARLDDDTANNSGSAYIFVKPGGGWAGSLNEVAKLTASDAAANDLFGQSVSISGDTAIVGVRDDDDTASGSGSAYIFVKPGGGWAGSLNEVAKLTASDAAAFDQFGFSVSISGDTTIVGAVGDGGANNFIGSAYIFVKPGGGWAGSLNEVAKLTASDATLLDNFGQSVSISGDTAIVGAAGDDDDGSGSGSAYIFVKPGGGWAGSLNEVAKLTASDAGPSDTFGFSVSILGDNIIVSAPNDDHAGVSSGSAYIFVKPGGGWAGSLNEVAKLTASDTVTGDTFGHSVSISGDTAIVGANLDNTGGINSGSAYVFGPFSIQEVDIDIKPGSDLNCINIKKKGFTPVAILGSNDFDVTTIDQTTLEIDDGDDDVVKLGRGIDATENCDSIGDTVNLGNPA